MPSNLRRISEMLHDREICHKVDVENGFVATKLPTKKYANKSRKHAIQIIVKVEEQGEFIRFIAPNVYTNSKSEHDMAIFKTCMHATRDDHLIQCCFNESTGEVYIQVEVFLGESSLSERQLIKSLLGIVDVVNIYDDAFQSAINTGTFIYSQIYSDRVKLATLAKKLFEVSSENLDQILKQLEYDKAPTSSQGQHLPSLN